MDDLVIIAKGLAALGCIVATMLSLANTVWGVLNRDFSRIAPAASWLALGAGLFVIRWSMP